MKRLIKADLREEISLIDLLDGYTFDEAIARLADQKQYWHEKYADAVEIKLDASYAGHDGGIELRLMVYRTETDKEFDMRKKIAQRARAAARERDRRAKEKALALLTATEAEEKALLKQLQAKYGDVQ